MQQDVTLLGHPDTRQLQQRSHEKSNSPATDRNQLSLQRQSDATNVHASVAPHSTDPHSTEINLRIPPKPQSDVNLRTSPEPESKDSMPHQGDAKLASETIQRSVEAEADVSSERSEIDSQHVFGPEPTPSQTSGSDSYLAGDESPSDSDSEIQRDPLADSATPLPPISRANQVGDDSDSVEAIIQHQSELPLAQPAGVQRETVGPTPDPPVAAEDVSSPHHSSVHRNLEPSQPTSRTPDSSSESSQQWLVSPDPSIPRKAEAKPSGQLPDRKASSETTTDLNPQLQSTSETFATPHQPEFVIPSAIAQPQSELSPTQSASVQRENAFPTQDSPTTGENTSSLHHPSLPQNPEPIQLPSPEPDSSSESSQQQLDPIDPSIQREVEGQRVEQLTDGEVSSETMLALNPQIQRKSETAAALNPAQSAISAKGAPLSASPTDSSLPIARESECLATAQFSAPEGVSQAAAPDSAILIQPETESVADQPSSSSNSSTQMEPVSMPRAFVPDPIPPQTSGADSTLTKDGDPSVCEDKIQQNPISAPAVSPPTSITDPVGDHSNAVEEIARQPAGSATSPPPVPITALEGEESAAVISSIQPESKIDDSSAAIAPLINPESESLASPTPNLLPSPPKESHVKSSPSLQRTLARSPSQKVFPTKLSEALAASDTSQLQQHSEVLGASEQAEVSSLQNTVSLSADLRRSRQRRMSQRQNPPIWRWPNC